MKRRRLAIYIMLIQLLLVSMMAAPVSATDNGIISGSVYNDVNGNGQPEIGEPNVTNATIYLLRDGDATPATFLTDAEGYFVATNLSYGVYQVWAEDAALNLSGVQIIELDEVNGASSVELPIVYDMSDDVEYLSVSTNIFLPFVNR